MLGTHTHISKEQQERCLVKHTVLALVVRGDDLDEVLEQARAHRLRDELLLLDVCCSWGWSSRCECRPLL